MSVFTVQAEDDHGHAHEKKGEHKEDLKDEHAGEHKEEGHDEHGADGFKLADNVIKNFGLKMVVYKGPSMTLPQEAIFRGLSEVNIYRLRQGLYKRIDFKTLEKTKSTIKLSSGDLAPGDKIVVDGIGFLRIAEIAASGGISDSHSH
jgi:hypothetical protein